MSRTPSDFAIEFGEYLAKAAENYLEATRTNLHPTTDMWTDSHRALRSAIYEFRKRAARAKATGEPQS